MRPILTITLNPALDLSTRVDRVVAGPKLRCESPQRDPGGGGLNVSRVIATLGGASRAFVALGGHTGNALLQTLEPSVPEVVRFPIAGETRQSLSVIETATGQQYRFVLPGPPWTRTQARAAHDTIIALCEPGRQGLTE